MPKKTKTEHSSAKKHQRAQHSQHLPKAKAAFKKSAHKIIHHIKRVSKKTVANRRNLTVTMVLFALLCVALVWLLGNLFKTGKQNQYSSLPHFNMQISSNSFLSGQSIPVKFTCQGESISPEIVISEVPLTTKSLALIMDDPDAPNGTFTHWVLWNIPAPATVIAENFDGSFGIQGANSTGENNYIGPCPPSGTHRYFFHLYALDTTLDLPLQTNAEELRKAMQEHILEHSEMMGTYQKS